MDIQTERRAEGGGTVARINCRVCDICGEQLGGRDAQFRLIMPRRARMYYGYPDAGMYRYDFCDNCMVEMMVEIQMRRKKPDAQKEATP